MRFGILGPLQIEDDGTAVDVSAPQQRALLALLLVHANEVLSVDRLLEELWGEDQPGSGVNTLRFHVSRLRKALGAEAQVITRPPGYVLEVGRGDFDVYQFEDLAREGRALLGTDPLTAGDVLRRALALWRGEPLDEFAYESWAATEAHRLTEMHRSVVADRIEADLAAGANVELSGELEKLASANPYDERFTGQLMRALYRSGRQADALRAYQRTRSRLGDDLGIEPSPGLQQLEEQILLQSSQLEHATQITPPTHLPHYLTAFVGRTEELQRIGELLSIRRLVTLSGPGGIGKTRTAVEVAASVADGFRHGVVFVDLATAGSAAEVAEAFAETLRVRAEPESSLEAAITAHLLKREMLLVVDNCESILEAAAILIVSILGAAPSVTVMTTSREPLGVPGEVVYRLPPLSVTALLPGAQPDALQLLVERAAQRQGDFVLDDETRTLALRICERLDGIPLAIELAAARLRVLSLEELEGRLNERFALLTSGDRTVTPRHQALEASLAFSYDSLDAIEQKLFRHLSVFRGGFDLAAAEGCNAWLEERPLLDVLTRLVDTSMVTSDVAQSVPYSMLETIREYGVAKLAEEDDGGDAHRSHAGYFWRLVQDLAPAIDAGDQDAVGAIEANEANIRAAFDWSLHEGDPAQALALGAGMGEFWFHHRDHDLASRLLATAIEKAEQPDPETLLRALRFRAEFATWLGRPDEATELTGRMRSLADSTDDRALVARSLVSQAIVAWGRMSFSQARALVKEALQDVGVDAPERVRWLAQMSFLSSWMGDVEAAGAAIEELEKLRSANDAGTLEAYLSDARGTLALQVGDLHLALDRFREAGKRYERLGMAMHVWDMLQWEAVALLEVGEADEADPLVSRVLGLADQLNDPRMRARGVLVHGRLALARSEMDAARARLRAALRLSHAADDRAGVVWALLAMATRAHATGEAEKALFLHGLVEGVRLELEVYASARRRADQEIAAIRMALDKASARRVWAEALESGYSAVPGLAEISDRLASSPR